MGFIETVYVIVNLIISFFYVLTCKHVIDKLRSIIRMIGARVCSYLIVFMMQAKVEFVKNLTMLIINTLLILIVLSLRILSSLYVIHDVLHSFLGIFSTKTIFHKLYFRVFIVFFLYFSTSFYSSQLKTLYVLYFICYVIPLLIVFQ